MSQRDHIIREATKMFVNEGLKSIRMDDIAGRLSISKRTLYELFGDKETLISECILHNHRMMVERAKESAATAENALEEIMLMLQTWDSSIESRHKLMVSLYKFYPDLHKKIVCQEQAEGFPMFRQKLEEGVRQGLIIPGLDYDLTIRIFTGAVQGIMAQDRETSANDGSDISCINLFRHILIFFIRSLTTEKGMKIIDKYI